MKYIILIAVAGVSTSCRQNKLLFAPCQVVTVRDTITLPADHIHYERHDGMPGCYVLPADTVYIENQFCQPKK